MNYISLFSGMECAWQAWHPLGWKCVAVAEVDLRACEVLAHRINASAPKYLPQRPDNWPAGKPWPYVRKAYAHLPPFGTPGTVPNLGDVSQVTEGDIAALGHVDVLIGGSPCQDLSIAGKRKGLAGARSSLFHQQLRIFDVAHRLCGSRWLVWENVPGAFSSNAGRDFAVVAGSLAGCDLTVPVDGWGNEGLAVGPNGLVEWSVLDAQWFGVAQRRRRVFAVLDTGNWTDRRPVLLEPDSLRGDSPPRHETGQNPAPTISARTSGGGGLGTDFDLDGGLIPEVTNALTAHNGQRNEVSDAVNGAVIPVWPAEVACTLNAAFGDKQGLEDQHALSGASLFVPAEGIRVRRLTPRECERLQGVEDDWTLVPSGPKGKPMADGPRYKILGNSFARPVITWIGRQIERATLESA